VNYQNVCYFEREDELLVVAPNIGIIKLITPNGESWELVSYNVSQSHFK